MSWRDYDEIYLSPRHEAQKELEKIIQREKLDAELSELEKGD